MPLIINVYLILYSCKANYSIIAQNVSRQQQAVSHIAKERMLAL